jgi:Spy/CpxP family protein refolding chaperone
MWQRVKPCLIVLSATLNASFVAMWIAYAAPSRMASEPSSDSGPQDDIWCPLHRQLNVTPQQWRRIEPRLKQFQAAVGELAGHVDRTRSEVIDLLAAPEPDETAIRARQDEILATKRKMQGLVVAHLLAEKEILTDGQQQQLFQLLRDQTSCAGSCPPMSGRSLRPGLGEVLRENADPQRAGGSR